MMFCFYLPFTQWANKVCMINLLKCGDLLLFSILQEQNQSENHLGLWKHLIVLICYFFLLLYTVLAFGE